MPFDVSLGAAVLAGLLSFLSPCVLPLVPPYLCYIAGLSLEEIADAGPERGASRRVLAASLAFVLGFATIFVALGASASVVGQALSKHAGTLTTLAGIVIILMGLHFLGLLRIPLLYREARLRVERRPAGLVGAYVVGLAFAFGWTPCVGPVLTAILMVAGAEDTAGRGALLLALYALGIGIPFLLAAAFAQPFLAWMRGFRRHLGTVEKAMGALLVVTGVLFLTNAMPTLSYWLLDAFPALGRIG
ncbi:MAG: cytochrome c biogenesis protein CcdA [Pseudomonadota bacterium]|nr:cytochrome c biogenesis protein CcdA [Pseudomonadota bacterium]